MRILNTTKGTVICEQGRRADSFLSRTRGLMGVRHLDPQEGLILTPCTSIHTCFMRFPLDVIFIKQEIIVGLVLSIPPWRVSPIYWGAHYAIELAAGAIVQSLSAKGDRIAIL